MPSKLYHHHLEDESPLLDGGRWLPIPPEKALRRHTLGTAVSHRAFTYNPYFAASQASTLVTSSPIIPPKPVKRSLTNDTDTFVWQNLPAHSRKGSINPYDSPDQSFFDGTSSRSARKRDDRRQDGAATQSDDTSALLKDLITEMDGCMLPDDAQPCLSRATTLCEKEDLDRKMSSKSSRTHARIDTKSPSDTLVGVGPIKIAASPKDIVRSNFAKVWYYKNSHLPPYLPAIKIHTGAWPLLTLAARFAKRAYGTDQTQVIEDHIKSSSMRPSRRTAVLRSVRIDDMHIIVFAIRGTHNLLDWTVNWAHTPVSPEGFLDDTTNLCHSGFLNTAELMIETAAARLRLLLEAKRGTGPVSLLFTGHSSGGASAQLLYAHMMSTMVQSELTDLRFAFHDIHCVTFGVPPLSLRPLARPSSSACRGGLFLSFANEGDPVVRADRQVIPSLFKLYMTPLPKADESRRDSGETGSSWFWGCLGRRKPTAVTRYQRDDHTFRQSLHSRPSSLRWNVPRANLALAGSIVLLREKNGVRQSDQIEACDVSNDMLQTVIFGDPYQHSMNVYVERLDQLAKEAVTSAYEWSNDF